MSLDAISNKLYCLSLIFLVCLTQPIFGNKLATVKRTNGETFGPFQMRPFHSHYDYDYEAPRADALVIHREEEEIGSGYILEGSGYILDGSGILDDEDYTRSRDEFLASERSKIQNSLISDTEQPIIAKVNEETKESTRDLSNIVGLLPRVPAFNAPSNSAESTTGLQKLTTEVYQPPSDTPTHNEAEHFTTAWQNSPTSQHTSGTYIVEQTTESPYEEQEQDSACIEKCALEMHASFAVRAKPNVAFIEHGSSLTLTCSVRKMLVNDDDVVDIVWIFEGESELKGECAIGGNVSGLRTCETFESASLRTLTNETHLTRALTVNSLLPNNTGYFICQAAATCCSGAPLLTQHRRHLTVWTADYSTQLLVMAGLVFSLSVLLLTGTVYRRRLQGQAKQGYITTVVLPPAVKDSSLMTHTVLPLPRPDSLDSFE